MMYSLASTAVSCCSRTLVAPSVIPFLPSKLQNSTATSYKNSGGRRRSSTIGWICCSDGSDSVAVEHGKEKDEERESSVPRSSAAAAASSSSSVDKDINKVVQKAATTFAPRASTASRNPAVPGTVLYQVFEVQGYLCMVLGGALSFNLIFPSNEPDIWRLMGMWSIWMFTIPSLRARDCSKNEKEALNYLFLVIPVLNVLIPFLWKSFAVVWSADTAVFFMMYAWKLGWPQKAD